MADNSIVIAILTGLVTLITSGFALWKSYFEAQKNHGKITDVKNEVDRCYEELEEAKNELNQARRQLQSTERELRIAQAEREDIRKELYREREKIILLQGQNANQEVRILQLNASIVTLTKLFEGR